VLRCAHLSPMMTREQRFKRVMQSYNERSKSATFSSSTVGLHFLSIHTCLTRSRCSGKLRPITSSYLNTILELLLNYIVSLSLPHHAAPKAELVSTISDEHEISKEVCTQVMSWFGEIRGDKWAMDVDAVLTEVGLGILRNYKVAFSDCPLSSSST
jgi:hypothetical protein